VVFPGSIHDGRARIKTASTNTNIFCVFLHLPHILVVLPPIYDLGNRPSWFVPLSHATGHEGARRRINAVVVFARKPTRHGVGMMV
jgi:hypothetical protein